MKDLDSTKFSMADIEVVIDNYQECICDLLKVTPRFTKKVLSGGCLKAFGKVNPDIAMFVSQMLAAYQFCKDKVHSYKSGVKLSPAVKKVVLFMKHGQSTTPAKVVSPGKARKLKRRGSGEGPESPAKRRSSTEGLAGEATTKKISHEDIYKAFGAVPPLTLPTSLQEALSPMSVSDATSDEELANDTHQGPRTWPPVPMGSSSSSKGPLIFMDSELGCLTKFSNGQMIRAKMKHGENGDALGQFPGETEWIQSEMPNMLVDLVVMKKPAAQMKRPAARKAPAFDEGKMKQEEEEDDDAEEEEEDAEEEEEAEEEKGPGPPPPAPPPPAPPEQEVQFEFPTYDEAKAGFSGSPAEWLLSDDRKSAIARMSKSEVAKRRFQKYRSDFQ